MASQRLWMMRRCALVGIDKDVWEVWSDFLTLDCKPDSAHELVHYCPFSIELTWTVRASPLENDNNQLSLYLSLALTE